MTPGPLATTAIGSLPHRELEPALQAAFQTDIPCLPELPGRSSAELLLPRGLEGLPGLRLDASGGCAVDLETWRRGRLTFQKRLSLAIGGRVDPSPLAPTPEACAAWEPFLAELRVRGTPLAKIQLVGPLTASRATPLDDGRPLAAELSIANQVFQLLVGRALAMVRAVSAAGARPIFFFDEPALTGLMLGAARNLMALQELRVSILALRRAGALVGLHCCGEAQWERLLPLGLHFLSFDARESLGSLLRRREELAAFAATGGRLALGMVPSSPGLAPDAPEVLADEVCRRFGEAGSLGLLRTALLTPACGLATGTESQASRALEALAGVQSALAQNQSLA